nr:tetrapyrrole methylase [Betaproteobacteria bacterium]
MLVWNEHTASHPAIAQESIAKLLEWLNQGYPVGLLSDAGLPAVADPGQALIAAVHRAGYPVRPHIGPSSIMLALMASGLNGQHFEFKGYLPADTAAREAALGAIEALSQKDGRSVIWIETPYRNDAMMTSIIRCLKADTEVCVATALGTEKQSIHTRTVADWRRRVWQPGREPSVFILGCQPALTQAAVATEHLKTHRRKHP